MDAQRRDKLAVNWINGLSVGELRYALTQCVFALIDDEQIAYRYDDSVDETGREIAPEDVIDEGLYWKANGELITEP